MTISNYSIITFLVSVLSINVASLIDKQFQGCKLEASGRLERNIFFSAPFNIHTSENANKQPKKTKTLPINWGS